MINHTNKRPNSKFCLFFLILFEVLSNEQGNQDDYSAMEVILSLRAHGWMISNNEQHDAYEFFQLIVTTLNEEADKIFTIDKDMFKMRSVF